MKTMSDWQAIKLLIKDGPAFLERYLVYKACVSFAINGLTHEAESELDPVFRQLLEVRRILKRYDLDAARAAVDAIDIPKSHPNYFELSGDREVILGMIAHREGRADQTAQNMEAATVFYRQGKDAHRTLRALINQKICQSTLETYTTGELFFLKQDAAAQGFHDLVGNIEKAAVSELLRAQEFTEAINTAQRALIAYQLDGCPEDKSVAQALLAIALWLGGEIADAKRTGESLLIRDGKVTAYWEILMALISGREPQVPSGNPLEGVVWKRHLLPKENSIPGRVLQRLRDGSADRDELIRAVWGENAIHPSYSARFYTVIKDLRGKYNLPIEFDGACYRLASKR